MIVVSFECSISEVFKIKKPRRGYDHAFASFSDESNFPDGLCHLLAISTLCMSEVSTKIFWMKRWPGCLVMTMVSDPSRWWLDTPWVMNSRKLDSNRVSNHKRVCTTQSCRLQALKRLDSSLVMSQQDSCLICTNTSSMQQIFTLY